MYYELADEMPVKLVTAANLIANNDSVDKRIAQSAQELQHCIQTLQKEFTTQLAVLSERLHAVESKLVDKVVDTSYRRHVVHSDNESEISDLSRFDDQSIASTELDDDIVTTDPEELDYEDDNTRTDDEAESFRYPVEDVPEPAEDVPEPAEDVPEPAEDVPAEDGIEPTDEPEPAEPMIEPVVKAAIEQVECQWCGRMFKKKGLPQHARKCKNKPLTAIT